MKHENHAPNKEELFSIIEHTKDAVAVLSGMRRQLIEEGWDERNAEQLVMLMVHNYGGAA